MADEPRPTYAIIIPLWLVVGRRLWLDGRDDCIMLIGLEGIGHVPAFFTDEHLAIEFLDDAGRADWCTILVRDEREFLSRLRVLDTAGVKDAGFDFSHPRVCRDRAGCFVAVRHLIERIAPKDRGD